MNKELSVKLSPPQAADRAAAAHDPLAASVPQGRASLLVLGRGVGAFGAALASFALDVWVYLQTGSYATFATLAILAMLPPLLIGPIAGVLIDRSSKKIILVACDLLSLLATLTAVIAHRSGLLSVPLVTGVMVLLALAETIRWPTTGAAISSLVSGKARLKVNGIAETCRSAAVMVGPVSGAALLQWFGLNNVLLATCTAYLLGVCALAFIVTDRPVQPAPGGLSRARADFSEGFFWLKQHKGLMQLLFFFAGANFAFSVYIVSQAPYVLSFTTPRVLGICFALDGVGIFIGGLVFARSFHRVDLSQFIIVGILLEAAIMVLWGIVRSDLLLYVCACGVGVMAALVNAASQTIWQSIVPLAYQGRVFSLRSMIVSSLAPVAILLSIPAAEHVLLPLLDVSTNTAVSHCLTAIWGTGKASALGLLVSSFAIGVATLAVVLQLRGGLRISGELKSTRNL